jgi:hypothetical protein
LLICCVLQQLCLPRDRNQIPKQAEACDGSARFTSTELHLHNLFGAQLPLHAVFRIIKMCFVLAIELDVGWSSNGACHGGELELEDFLCSENWCLVRFELFPLFFFH